MTVSDADRAKAAEVTQRKPLTALEWLRVTHADTLSGRRIEEALAEARAPYDRLTADLRALAEELDGDAAAAEDLARDWTRLPDGQGRLRTAAITRRGLAARLRAVVAATEEEKA